MCRGARPSPELEVLSMTLTAERLKSELSELPLDDRDALALYLIESLDGTADEVQSSWRDEVDRRFAEIESGSAVGEPAEKVIAELRRKYS
jgi:putative addiction module component (TIGR02574 family)